MKKFLFIAIFFITLGLSFLYCAPYYAAHTLQKASANQDIATLEKYIDINEVRTKLKTELMARAQANYEASQAFATDTDEERAAVMAMVSDFMDNATGELINAERLSGILAEAIPQEGREAAELTMGYSGQEHFMLSVQDAKKESPPVVFVLEKKDFFTWHVTEIVFSE